MKINIPDLEFTDDVIRNYLTKCGYEIREHYFPFDCGCGNDTFIMREVALNHRTDIDNLTGEDEYRKVFERLITNEFQKVINSVVGGPEYTGYRDDGGEEIFVGDTLMNRDDGNVVVVIKGEDSGYYGKPVCDEKQDHRHRPHSLNNGSGYHKIK